MSNAELPARYALETKPILPTDGTELLDLRNLAGAGLALSLVASFAFDAGFFAELGHAFQGIVGYSDILYGAGLFLPISGLLLIVVSSIAQRVQEFFLFKWPDPVDRIRAVSTADKLCLVVVLVASAGLNHAWWVILTIPIFAFAGLLCLLMVHASISINRMYGSANKYWMINALMGVVCFALALYKVGQVAAAYKWLGSTELFTVQSKTAKYVDAHIIRSGQNGTLISIADQLIYISASEITTVTRRR